MSNPSTASYKALADRVQSQVIEYLIKKGYNRTEQMLRHESANLDKDGKPVQERAEDLGTAKYAKGFRLLSSWIEGNLDIYKVGAISELKRTAVDILHSLNLGDCYGQFSSILFWILS